MTQRDFKQLLNKASMRLVYFDPNTGSGNSFPSHYSSPVEELNYTVQHYFPSNLCNSFMQNQMLEESHEFLRPRHEFAEPRFVPRNQRIQNFQRRIWALIFLSNKYQAPDIENAHWDISHGSIPRFKAWNSSRLIVVWWPIILSIWRISNMI